MTKHENSDTRRLQVAEGLFATVAERGLEATTLRDVAVAAGVSVGLVQRYFRTRAELLRFGIEVIYERAESRIQHVVIAPPVRKVIAEVVKTMLPLDDARGHEFRVLLAFWQTSLHDPEMAATHREATHRLIDGLADAFAGAQRTGELPEDLDPGMEARLLMALVDGLALHATVTQDVFDESTVGAALDAYLERLFGASEGKR